MSVASDLTTLDVVQSALNADLAIAVIDAAAMQNAVANYNNFLASHNAVLAQYLLAKAAFLVALNNAGINPASLSALIAGPEYAAAMTALNAFDKSFAMLQVLDGAATAAIAKATADVATITVDRNALRGQKTTVQNDLSTQSSSTIISDLSARVTSANDTSIFPALNVTDHPIFAIIVNPN